MQLNRESLDIKFLPNMDGNSLFQFNNLLCIACSFLSQNGLESPSIVSIVPRDLSSSFGLIQLILCSSYVLVLKLGVLA